MAARFQATTRRGALRVLAGGLLAAGTGTTAPAGDGIVIVSKERVLRESAVASRLRRAEEAMTGQLQLSLDSAKAQLAAEEAELTQLRTELEPEVFDARAQDFDRRIRTVRREAQERAALLQRGFQEARASIVRALPAILEKVRVEAGASVVLNADQVLAVEAGVDRTDRVIELLDTELRDPPVPQIDLSRPLMPAPAPQAETSDQQ